jgi:lysozyme family protein
MIDFTAMIADSETRWGKCIILPSRLAEVTKVAQKLIEPSAKLRYQYVEAATGVPWFIVAVIAERESDADFTKQLGQGDPLDQISKNVPKGMGPYLNHPTDGPGHDAWHRCAVDTLQNTAPYTARWKNWTEGGSLCILVQYNGLGYWTYHNHMPSPYDWAATNQEKDGKYTGDGRFNPTVWDTQIGCAAMLIGMQHLDPSIQFAEAA